MDRKTRQQRLSKSVGPGHEWSMQGEWPTETKGLSGEADWFRLLFERSADTMTLIDPLTMTILDGNETFSRASGIDRDRISGLSPREISPPHQPDGRDSLEVVREAVGLALRNGTHRTEWLAKHRDGGLEFIDVVFTSLTLGGREVVLTTARNIDDRKRAEEEVRNLNRTLEQRITERTAELRRSEERFKALFEFSPLGMARVSREGRLLQVNESFAKMIGCTPEEATELSYREITPHCYDGQEKQIPELLRRHGRFGPFEMEYIHRDGNLVPIVINGMNIPGSAGDDEWWGIAEDITPRHQAEQAIRESERKFRTLFESSSQGVMLHDENHRFSEVNPAAAKILGRTPEDCVGRHPADLAPEYQANGERSETVAEREIRKCFDEGLAQFEWTHNHKDGHEMRLEVILNRIPHGNTNLMQAIVTDISERKRVEMELKRSLERERELNQLKSNFVSMVSHEFRTPLGIIQSSAEILNDYLDRLDAAERAEQLGSIIKNSRRMAGLMEDVLLLGRLDSGRMDFAPRPLDLTGLCRRLVDEVRSTADGRCVIESSTANLPAEAMADERLLRHILLNLLSNAVKYSRGGNAVTFRATSEGGLLRFVIRDQGIGIPEDDLPGLFEAFRRGSNVGRTPGTGLGLVIVKQSVELHRGTIDVETRQGVGTTFTITIPLS